MHSGNSFTGRWIVEPKPQTIWHVPHAVWFFAMGVGGALNILYFLFGVRLGTWFGLELAEVLGVVLVGIGGLILIADLGHPLMFWRALRNVRMSWIAVGAVADFVFLFAELLLFITALATGGTALWPGLPWAEGTVLGFILQLLAAVSALIVITYPGLVLAASPAIPFWNNALVPLQFLSFAFASAAGLGLLIQAVVGPQAAMVERLALIALVSTALTLLFLALHLLGAYMQRGTARLSALVLARGALSTFHWVALLAGVVLPLVLLGVGLAVGAQAMLGWLVLSGLLLCAANWAYKYLVLKAGIYAPLF